MSSYADEHAAVLARLLVGVVRTFPKDVVAELEKELENLNPHLDDLQELTCEWMKKVYDLAQAKGFKAQIAIPACLAHSCSDLDDATKVAPGTAYLISALVMGPKVFGRRPEAKA